MNDFMNVRLDSLGFICACEVFLREDLSGGETNLFCTSALVFTLLDGVILLCVVLCRLCCRMKKKYKETSRQINKYMQLRFA